MRVVEEEGEKVGVEEPQEVGVPPVGEIEGVKEPTAGEPVAAMMLDGDTLGVVEWEGLREAVREDDPVKVVVMEPEKEPPVVGELDNDPPPSKPLEVIKREGVWELVGEVVGEWMLEGEEEGHWDPLSVTLPLGVTLGLLL